MRHALAIFAILLALSAGPAGHAAETRLDDLFRRLAQTHDPAEGDRIARAIWDVWNRAPDEVTGDLMDRGQSALYDLDTDTALAAFNAVVEREPHYAEGWNKRATVYYVIGNFDASIADIARVLQIEPRHFGALAGLGMAYDALNDRRMALRAYRAALQINPYLDDVRERADTLEREILAGQI
ncbi:MAG: hypothetical protein AB7T18_17740 [Alphaproteobacteria bacterium]